MSDRELHKMSLKLFNMLDKLTQSLVCHSFNVKSEHVDLAKSIFRHIPSRSRSNREEINARIANLSGGVALVNLEEVADNWVLVREFYIELCKISYKINQSLESAIPDKNADRAARKYCAKGYWKADTKSAAILNKYLQRLFEEIPIKGRSFGSGNLKRSIRPGYTVYNDVVNYNQYHVEELSQQSCDDVEIYFRNSPVFRSLEQHLGYFLKICNVRAYRYFHSVDNDQIFPHRDALGPGVFKIMAFDGNIELSNGPFQILKDRNNIRRFTKKFLPNEVVESCTGLNPFMIVNANEKIHQAPNPEPGLVRDTVELTLMARLEWQDLVTVGGCQAGFPLNPFAT